MVQAPSQALTLAEFLQLPETKPASEYLDGESIQKPMPNILHRMKHGTQSGWLIDPAEPTVFVYRPQQETAVFDGPGEELLTPAFAKELQLTVEALFAWLLE